MPLAVTVAEGKTQAPPIPGHDFMAKEGQPRLVVFGDASWISNPLLQQAAPNHFNLFASSSVVAGGTSRTSATAYRRRSMICIASRRRPAAAAVCCFCPVSF